ncbi:MAG: ribosomal RNA small subunit methyltransferase A [Deltaproteobacteria bacterium]|nr:ribosomal RNA small subunit methyltransferase A [Deltaproteobacteria bacterium]
MSKAKALPYGCIGFGMMSLRQELKEYGLSPRKKLGQHFLSDRNILDKVIRAAGVNQEDVILEVGPGLGEMTLALAQNAKEVIAVEIDSKLADLLREKVSGLPNVKIILGDILKIDFNSLFRETGRPFKVVANLPYQISTPLLFRFIESKKIFSSFTLMLQREVAERIVASPGEKEYGPLSVFIQIFSDVSILFFIKPSAFFPPPKVESAVVHLVWKEDPLIELKNEKWFKKVVKASFCYRRKTLINALKHSEISLPESIELKMDKLGIDPQRRPGTLTLQEFIRLADALK